MRCLRCGNEDTLYFYQDSDVFYCRRCVGFGRVDVGTLPSKRVYRHTRYHTDYVLKYPLTTKQKVASDKIVQYLLQKKNVLVYAACGARQNRTDDGGYKVIFKSREKGLFCNF